MACQRRFQPKHGSDTAYARNVLVRLCAAFSVLGFAIVVSQLYLGLQSADRDAYAQDQIISVQRGMSGQEVSRVLQDAGIIRSAQVFRLLMRVTGSDEKLQAGYYSLNASMQPHQIIDRLKNGRTVTYRVTIREGYQLKDIAATLALANLADYDRFMELALDASAVFGDELPVDLPIASLEGYLFPDTYVITKGQPEEKTIQQMVGRFLDVVLPAVQEYLSNSRFSLHEIITLASIVEKEVMVDGERPIVAGVYLNRLDINMRLQADPTVRYVMTEERSRVLFRDLEIDSPYNTYMYHGLPPGPIASPGLRSIQAVLNPADVEYYFFVSRRDGTHEFTRTHAEHVAARRQLGY